MQELYEKEVRLSDENCALLRKKAELQSKFFSISKLQDTKPSSILYRLGEKVDKHLFPPRDHELLQNGTPASLDSLAKVFAISFPYSAIGLIEGNIYISLSQPKRLDLGAIVKATIGLVNSDLSSRACIPQVSQFYQVLSEHGNQYVEKILMGQKKLFFRKFKHAPKGKELYNFSAEDDRIFFQNFTARDIQNIKELNIERLHFHQVIPDIDESHIHVELNLVAEIIANYGTDKPISLGLASSNIREKPGCCGYCKATLDSVSEVLRLNIHRTCDFPQNIPKGHWDFPFKLLDMSEKSFLFFRNLMGQYTIVDERDLGEREAFEKLRQEVAKFQEIYDRMLEIDTKVKLNAQAIVDIDVQLEPYRWEAAAHMFDI